MPDAKTRVITGSEEPVVKVWNLTTDPPSTDMTMNTAGSVTKVEVNGPTIMWATAEPLPGDDPELSVGMVHLLDIGTQTTLPIKRSAEMPYTHPQPVKCIAIGASSSVPYVVTAGTEGSIMAWRFDNGQFVKLSLCEGHIRAVTCLLIHNEVLWSGSADRTLRVWDITSGRCVGTIGGSPGNVNGHSGAVSCLASIPASAASPQGESYVVSGSIDGDTKLWKSDGSFVFSCNNGAGVTSLCYFQDALGGSPALVIGLFDSRILIRSCTTMALLVSLDSSVSLCNGAVWSVTDLGGQSCFASGGDDGKVVMWQLQLALKDGSS